MQTYLTGFLNIVFLLALRVTPVRTDPELQLQDGAFLHPNCKTSLPKPYLSPFLHLKAKHINTVRIKHIAIISTVANKKTTHMTVNVCGSATFVHCDELA